MPLTGKPHVIKDDSAKLLLADGMSGLVVSTTEQPTFPSTVKVLLTGGGNLLDDADGGVLLSGITANATTIGAFDDRAIFPEQVAKGSRGGPGWRTVVQETADGQEFCIANWQRPQITYDIAPAVQESAALAIAMNFYLGRRGSLTGFRFRDPNDYSTHHEDVGVVDVTDYRHKHVIGAGDGTTTTFQLVKRYSAGANSWSTAGNTIQRLRAITRPERGAVNVFLDGVLKTEGTHYTVRHAGGEIVFVSAPAAGVVIEWAGRFHVPMRFGVELDASMMADINTTDHLTLPSLPVVEINEAAVFSDHRWTGGFHTASFSEYQFVNVGWGFVQKLTPTTSGLRLFLPPRNEFVDGGPHVILINGSGSNTIAVHDGDTPATVVVTALAAGGHALFHLRPGGAWMATT